MSEQLTRQGQRPVMPAFDYALILSATVNPRGKSWHNQAVPVS